ncbi:ABC transporter permease [Rhodanobacter glycinis]|uniref:Putative ABC transport system permease protein n=1 Tax=Rhodanobacter glycinis TaxID=582702 RepID=A0A1I4A8V0_9GAMM|nr:FtsX-like permease family protein [Rhodanobacter glycinis]SFK52805.1 putative ABC transport system permease protein [Rhodanobacter glycinis]
MRHIVKPLLRHRMMPLLVVLQVALACAIACNALFLLQQKLVPLLTPDGVGQPQQLVVAWNLAPRGQPWPVSTLRQTAAELRAIPGVTVVSLAGSWPMETMAQMTGTVLADGRDGKADAVIYIGDHLRSTLDLKLVAGRDFSAAEDVVVYKNIGIDDDGPTIITRALANRLFPDGHALGKVIRIGDQADAGRRTVVGVVAHLMRNKFSQDNRDDIDYSMLFPGTPSNWPVPMFGVRVRSAAEVASVLKAVKATVQRELGSNMIQGIDPAYETYGDMRQRMLAQPRAAVWLLSGVSLIVLLVALVGIMGMTSYWVQQRTRQIGIRRALGAKRSDILHHIQWENLMVMSAGILLGMVLAYAVNLWLMRHYELTRLPWQYLPLGAVLMLALGQLAVLSPALRAAKVPPVVATRSV